MASLKPTNLFPVVEEIREMIFANLPINQLFLIQGVSKSWKASIQGSPKLGQKMYLTARSAPLDTIDSPVDVNGEECTVRFDKAAQYHDVLRFSPLIPHLTPPVPGSANSSFPIRSSHHIESSNKTVFVSFYIFIGALGAKDSKDSSFRRTFLTQPPVKGITIYRTFGRFETTKILSIFREDGVRCGDLIDQYKELWEDMIDGLWNTFRERVIIYMTIRLQEEISHHEDFVRHIHQDNA